MSLAFATLVIVLFGVLPGAAFDKSVYSGTMSRIRVPTPTLTDLAVAVGLSLPVHLITLQALMLFGIKPRVDYVLFFRTISGQVASSDGALESLASSVASYQNRIAAYLLVVLIVAVLLGQGVQFVLLVLPGLDRLLPFRNHWYYLMFFEQRKPVAACTGYVLTKTTSDHRPLLYHGRIADFRVANDGSLEEIVLRNPRRKLLEPGTEEPPAENSTTRPHDVDTSSVNPGQPSRGWLNLYQDRLVIPGDQVVNFSLKYTFAWQPLFILNHQELFFPQGSTEAQSVQLGGLISLIYRWLPVKVLVETAGLESDSLDSHVDRGSPLTIELCPRSALKDDVRVHVLCLFYLNEDNRAWSSGNLLYWLLSKGRDALSSWTNREIQKVTGT